MQSTILFEDSSRATGAIATKHRHRSNDKDFFVLKEILVLYDKFANDL